MIFDFTNAFEKVPHYTIVYALAAKGITDMTLQWFSSFLAERTYQVLVGIHLSSIKEVTSSVAEGLV